MRRSCEAAGADDFLVKPIDGTKLRDALAGQVSLEPTGGQGERVPDMDASANAPVSLDPGLARIFRDEADQRLDAIGQALESADRAALGRHAHALKSASRHAGCEALADASRRLERMAPEADAPALGDAVKAVRDAWAGARLDVDEAARTETGSTQA
jgi:HPt (histidine-containing phosphotransfer) domain-containing protein